MCRPLALALIWFLVPSCGPLFPDLEQMHEDLMLDASTSSPGRVTCGMHETEFPGPVCVSRSRDRAAARFSTPVPTAGSLFCAAGDRSAPAVSKEDEQETADHHLVLAGLVASVPYGCAYAVTSGPGAGTISWSIALDPARTSDGPVITEVLLNPAGSEPAQEFVEILNSGSAAIDLEGYRLADADPRTAEDPTGDEIPSGAVLDPGQVALLVPSGFVPGDGPDPPPAGSCLIVWLDGSLCRSGLRNSGGEPVYLSDPRGALVSIYPNALGTTDQGMSAQRLSVEAPDGDTANWIQSTPTPGLIPVP